MSSKPKYQIEDFTIIPIENGKIDVSYFDNNIVGHTEHRLEGRYLAKWIEEKEYNLITYDTEFNGIHNQSVEKCDPMDFLEIHLEEKHVLGYLKEKGVIK